MKGFKCINTFHFILDGYDEIPTYHQPNIGGNSYYTNQPSFNSHRQNHYETSL